MNKYLLIAQSTSELSTYQAVNAIAFLVFLLVVTIGGRSILKLGNEAHGKKRFVELEKDYRWRRVKVLYLAASVLIMFFVISTSYASDEIAPLQTALDFELERAEARFDTVLSLLLTVTLLWAIYRFALPWFYDKFMSLKNYVSKSSSDSNSL